MGPAKEKVDRVKNSNVWTHASKIAFQLITYLPLLGPIPVNRLGMKLGRLGGTVLDVHRTLVIGCGEVLQACKRVVSMT